MTTSILETLINAEYNLDKNRESIRAYQIGLNQLHNAVLLLRKGYKIYDEIEPLFDKYDNIESIPPKE